jgi:hypothetical protein
MLPVSSPRNKNCADMIKRMENPTAEQTLNIKIRADQILNERRSEEFKQQLAHCLENRLPFILYEDDTKFKHGNYYVVIPGQMKMLCFMDRRLKAETKSTSVNSFTNNLHLAIAAYDKIWIPQGKVEGKVLLLD